jgi:hypothetical protein
MNIGLVFVFLGAFALWMLSWRFIGRADRWSRRRKNR